MQGIIWWRVINTVGTLGVIALIGYMHAVTYQASRSRARFVRWTHAVWMTVLFAFMLGNLFIGVFGWTDIGELFQYGYLPLIVPPGIRWWLDHRDNLDRLMEERVHDQQQRERDA